MKRKSTLFNYFSASKLPKLDDFKENTEIPGASEVKKQDVNNVRPLVQNMDISLFRTRYLTDSEKLQVLKNRFVPSEDFVFPVTCFGGQNRKFSIAWLKKYPWLAYSALENSAYCVPCVLFAPNEVGMSGCQGTGSLVKTGFTNWKKALQKFEQHKSSTYHKNAIVNSTHFTSTIEGDVKSIHTIIDTVRDRQARENVEKIKPILKTIILCGKQGLALRGHRDSGELDLLAEPQENEGNFRAILRARVEAGDENLRKHFENCAKNAMYISWKFQNEVINICDQIIRKKIIDEVKSAKFFSVLADETCDISTTEQFTLCLRYVKLNSSGVYVACENFVRFMPVTSTTGRDLAESLIKGLQECDLDLTNLRGQGYDGAAAMSGKFKGVQAIISESYPTAFYSHCASHGLNLSLTQASDVPGIRRCFGVIEKMYTFFNTPKRQNILEKHVHQLAPESRREKLKQLCPTRWVQRHDAVFVMRELLYPVAAALEEIESWEDKTTASQANLLLNAITQSDFLISLVSAEKLLAYTLNLSKELQRPTADLLSALSHAENIVNQIRALRNNADSEFQKLFALAKKDADYLGTSIMLPRRLGNKNQNIIETVEQYYRRAIFLPWVDCLVNSMSDRFIKHKKIFESFHCVLQYDEKPERNDYFWQLTETYASDMNSSNKNVLLSEFEMWTEVLKKSLRPPECAIDVLNFCDKKMYPNIHTLLKIFVTLPVTVSTAERSFSTLRRLKTYLRSTMGENRLNGLANLNIHREIPVSCEEIISVLKMSKRRLEFVL